MKLLIIGLSMTILVTMSQLTVTIITKDCEKTIRACLESIKPIADEIIILDSGSQDDTVNICREYTELVTVTDWPGYGVQKQRALEKATKPWVLSLDSDEVLSPDLQQAILDTIEQPKHQAYRVHSKMIFAGQLMEHGGCAMNPIRLLKRGKTRFSDCQVHEGVLVDGSIGKLPQHLYHYSYESVEHWLNKMNHYSSLSNLSKINAGRHYSISKAVLSGLATFFKMYVLKAGFLDGRMGFVYSVNWAVSNYYKYLKLAINPQFSIEDIEHRHIIRD